MAKHLAGSLAWLCGLVAAAGCSGAPDAAARGDGAVSSEAAIYQTPDSELDGLRERLAKDPGDEAARVALARRLLATSTGAEVVELCQQGLALDSTAVALYNLVAAAYAREGRYALAIQSLETAVRIRPQYGLGFANLGGLHTRLGEYERAERYLQEALRLVPEEPSIRRRLAELCLLTDRPAAATAHLQEIIPTHAQDATLHFLLGKALAAQGMDEAAWRAFEVARRLDIGFEEAHYRAAVLAARLGRNAVADSAMKAFARLQKLGADKRDTRLQMTKLRLAILNAPEDPEHHYNLGAFFAQHEYYEEALNQFARVLALRPTEVRALNRSGNILLRQGRVEAALEAFNAALRIAPDYPVANMNAAQIYMQTGRAERALAHCQRVVRAAPGVPAGWYYLAQCLDALGRAAEADSAIARGLALADPGGAMHHQLSALSARRHRATTPP